MSGRATVVCGFCGARAEMDADLWHAGKLPAGYVRVPYVSRRAALAGRICEAIGCSEDHAEKTASKYGWRVKP